jgi:CMP-N-acetylneuraminic acid synthetase
MTTVAAMVPMRHSSERVPGKNYRPLGGIPLYHHVIRALLEVPEITTVVIDTDSPVIMEDAAKAFPSVVLLERPEHLRAGEIPMNDVLLNTTSQVPADLYLQTHSTNPFLTAATISRGLRTLLDAGDAYDSLFGVTRLQARLWDKDTRPVNHDPKVLLRTQDLDPIYLENSCIYVFSPDTLTTYGNRIGARPLMFEIPPGEDHDIDVESEFALAEQMWSLRQAAS